MRLLRVVLVMGAVAAAMTVASGTASAAKPSYGCAPPFTLHAITAADYASLPRSQAAIDAGLVDLEGILAGASAFDQNGDNLICVQVVPGWDIAAKPFAAYLYNVVDNNASTP
jgi:hypothetical protein